VESWDEIAIALVRREDFPKNPSAKSRTYHPTLFELPSRHGYAFYMAIDELVRMHQAKPFNPFDIYLADGRTLPVEHPEFLARSPVGRTISVGLADGSHEIVDLLLVVSLKPRTNGTTRRRRRRG
jgi:hypothetical protein